jgi:hypothetical protein
MGLWRARGNEEEVASERAEQHALDALEVEQAVVRGSPHGLDQRAARVVAHHAQEPADIAQAMALGVALEASHVVAELGGEAQELFFLDGDIAAGAPALAARWAVGLVGDSFVARLEHAHMTGDQARAVEDLDALLGLSYLDRRPMSCHGAEYRFWWTLT